MPPDTTDFKLIADALQRDGWCVVDDFLAAIDAQALAEECRALDAAAALRGAATGRGAGRSESGLRGDRTRWFEAEALTPAQTTYWTRMEALRSALNRSLLLGLDHLEAHYALYPPGAGYARHRDRFRDDDARVVSSVVYLNAAWNAADGGALRLHLPEGERDVLPTSARAVFFLSAEIEHEVLSAGRERLSIAGWFRRRS